MREILGVWVGVKVPGLCMMHEPIGFKSFKKISFIYAVK